MVILYYINNDIRTSKQTYPSLIYRFINNPLKCIDLDLTFVRSISFIRINYLYTLSVSYLS